MFRRQAILFSLMLSALLSGSRLLPYGFARVQTVAANLSGIVVDESDAVISGVKITVVNNGTALQREVTSNSDGYFIIPLLPPGAYTLTAKREGFATLTSRDVVLNVNDQRSLQIQLKVGAVGATVEVKAGDPSVQMSPAVGTVIDRIFVGNLPLNGRSFQSLILLSPGVVATPSTINTPGEFSVNGQRQNTNYFTVDGVSANTGVGPPGTGSNAAVQFSQQASGAIPATTALGTTASMVSIDALEEFKIQTSTYSAEFGRQPGAQVQLVSRSGANQFRGTVFDYLRNDALDADNWFTPRFVASAARLGTTFHKPKLRQNQFGGIFSGPIFLPRFGEGGPGWYSGKDRTFFFFSYEGQRLRLPVLRSSAEKAPSLRLRQQAPTALQPFLNAFPLPTGPETTVGGVPTGTAPFSAAYSNPSAVDAYSLRIDQRVNSKLGLFSRYSETPSNNLTRTMNQLTGTVSDARTLTLGTTLSISSQANNEFRFNYSTNRKRISRTMDDLGGALPLTLPQLTSGYSGPGPTTGFFYYAPVGGSPLQLGDDGDNSTRQLNVVDNFSWVKGRRQLKFGFDWRRLDSTFGPFAFSQVLFFLTEASLMKSTADILQFISYKGARPIYDNYSLYAQDTWNLSPRLTLDFGVRWDVNPAPRDANGLRPVVLVGVDGADVSRVSIAPPSVPFYKTFWTAFAPRVGMAYQLSQRKGRETVLRGGGGVFYDLGSNTASNLFGGYPFSSTFSPSDRSFPISPALAQPPPFLPVPTQLNLPNQDFQAVNSELQLPYTFQWNIALEQVLGNQQSFTVSYVASAARKLLNTSILNQIFSPNPLTSVRPNPNVGNIYYSINGSSSDYHSLQLQYRRRFSQGLQTLVNYTWAHAIDNVSNDVFQGDLSDRGNSSFDVRHNFSAALSYDTPKLRSARLVAGPAGWLATGIVNGWSIDSVFYARTGTPINLNASLLIQNVVRPDGTSFNLRPDLVLGVPFWIHDATAPGGQRLNPAAFALPPRNPDPAIPPSLYIPTRQGTLARNAVFLPGIYQLNMAVRRQFNLTENVNLQIKAEAFNMLNHPLFGSYDPFVSSATFGRPPQMLSTSMGGLNALYQIGGPRSIQLSLRLSF